jgi:pyruvate-formate lyase-activating enzyme
MTLDGGWGLIIATVIGVVLVWLRDIAVKHFSNGEDDIKAAHEKIKEQEVFLRDIALQFQRYQTHVAENYAKIPAVERMETNIYSVMRRIEEKIDRLQGGGGKGQS